VEGENQRDLQGLGGEGIPMSINTLREYLIKNAPIPKKSAPCPIYYKNVEVKGWQSFCPGDMCQLAALKGEGICGYQENFNACKKYRRFKKNGGVILQ